VLFWKLALRPWPAHGLRAVGRALFFGLPGNPVAVMVSFYLLVRPALLTLMGRRDNIPPRLQAIAQHALPKKAGRTRCCAASWKKGGRLAGASTGDQGSGMLSSMSRANA